eukprot:GHUV01014040.1.p2 GENE.GHUV01014040.1~~GHUV01014040.1.p2  ORF type:complete len:182 (+),score=64.22 GHUV01014040.1:1022-1567(+)
MEIFTGSGEALTTRIYRGTPPHDHTDAGIEFVALDGEATLERVAAYEMVSIYPALQPQWQQVATGMEGLELEELLSDGVGVEALGLEQQQQQQVPDAGMLGRSLTLEKRKSDLASSLAGSFKDQPFLDRVLLSPRVSTNPDMAEKLQQLLMSPRAMATVAMPSATAFDEEEMTADIFGLEI